jgi:hypothetical protein
MRLKNFAVHAIIPGGLTVPSQLLGYFRNPPKGRVVIHMLDVGVIIQFVVVSRKNKLRC